MWSRLLFAIYRQVFGLFVYLGFRSQKVYPLEVEEVLAKHAKVEDVCVIGVPDDEWGTSVRAVIQLKKNRQAEPEEVLDFCRGELAGYKVPRSVVFVEELPRSPVGKMLREKVRETYGRPCSSEREAGLP